MSKYPIILELLDFLRSPRKYLIEKPDSNSGENFKNIFTLVCASIFIAFVFSYIGSNLSSLVGFNQGDNYIVVKNLLDLPVFIALGFLLVIGPFFEEMSFRMLLSKNKAKIVLGFFSFLVFLGMVFLPYLQIKSDYNFVVLIGLVSIAIIVGSIVYKFISKSWVENLWGKYFTYLVYSSSVIFALIHGTNYDNILKYFWLIPILVLPQLTIGFTIAFIRVKWGFWWGYLSHASYNFLVGIPVFSILFASENLRNYMLQTSSTSIDKLTSGEQNYLALSGIIAIISYSIIAIGLSYGLGDLWKHYRSRKV